MMVHVAARSEFALLFSQVTLRFVSPRPPEGPWLSGLRLIFSHYLFGRILLP